MSELNGKQTDFTGDGVMWVVHTGHDQASLFVELADKKMKKADMIIEEITPRSLKTNPNHRICLETLQHYFKAFRDL